MEFYDKTDLARKLGITKVRLNTLLGDGRIAQPTVIPTWSKKAHYTREQFLRLEKLWRQFEESKKQLRVLE